MAITRFPTTDDMLGPMLEGLFRPGGGRGGSAGELLRAPEADVVETEKEILVAVDVPGTGPDDIEIVLENNVLTVHGERRPQWGEEEGGRALHLAERRYGRFSRSFVLPRDVDHDAIQARFENGVLTVSIPKSEKARRRRIEIQGSGGDGQGARTEVR